MAGLTTGQKLLFIHGAGGNGKGMTLNTLARIAGDYAADVPASTLTVRRHEAQPESVFHEFHPRCGELTGGPLAGSLPAGVGLRVA